jgi:hypothetical protein
MTRHTPRWGNWDFTLRLTLQLGQCGPSRRRVCRASERLLNPLYLLQ